MPLSEFDTSWYVDQINKSSSSNALATANSSTSLITYPASLRSDESNIKSFEPEELVHALLINKLTSPEYKYPIERIYHEQYFAHGSAGSLLDEADIVIYDEDNLPYALFEIKSSEKYARDEEKAIKYQLFGTAPLLGSPKLLVYATIHPNSDAIDLKCIDYVKHRSHESWITAGKPFSTAFPVDYQDLNYIPYASDTSKDLKVNTTQSDFRSVANSFHNEFFGEHPDNALFINLVKCLLAKIHDERTTKSGTPYRFQVLYKNGKPQNSIEVFEIVNSLYRDAYSRYIEKDVTPDEIDPKEFSKEKVKSVVLALESLSITKGAALHGDIIGAFFEEILRSGFKQDKGMYFTHTNIVKFMIEAIDLDGLTKSIWNKASHPENRLPYVIDPACGSGAFLLHAMNRITNAIKSESGSLVSDFEEKQFYNARMSDETPNYWAENFIYGFDPKFIMAITSKVNMVLHGDGSAHMFKYDAFKPFSSYNDTKLRICNESERSIHTSHYPYELCETFDVVLSNPPFGVTLSPDTRRTLSKTFSLSDKLPSDALFIERAFQLLKPKGRLGIVLPESIFNASDLMPARLFLYKMFKIKAIVALPRNAFIDTPTLTSLLFAEKKNGTEISAWDKDWAENENYATEQVKKARSLASQWATGSIQDLQDRIFTLLSGIVDERDWSYKKGKNSEILEMKPKYSFPSIEEAREHYLSIFKSAGFEKHVQRFIFNKVAKIHNNSHHTYMVDEVGYKLSKRKEKPRPNQLITFLSSKGENVQNLHLCENAYFIKYDTVEPKTMLDFIKRDVKWGA